MPYPYNPAPYGAPYSNPYVDRYNAITAQNFAGAAQSYGGQITRVNGFGIMAFIVLCFRIRCRRVRSLSRNPLQAQALAR